MTSGKFDRFLAQILQRAREEFAFITPDYSYDLPAELVWVMIHALMSEKRLNIKTAAQTVHDYCVRKGNDIPYIMNGQIEEEQTHNSNTPSTWQ